MADSKITALTSISTSTDPANDPLVIVDVSDTSMAATGTTKKVTLNQLLGASGTATLASATITGDLTVDTSTLKVDSANNRVGIGTASPAAPLDVQGSSLRLQVQASSNGAYATWKYIGKNSTGTAVNFEQGLNITADNAFELYDNQNTQLVSRYVSGASGAHSWFLTGTTAMTLNSTGLGVGASPTTKLDVLGSGDGELRLRAGSDAALIFSETSANKNWKLKPSGGDFQFQYSATAYNSGYSPLMYLTATGNVGVGVTPSAWGSNKAIEGGVSGGKTGAFMFGSDGSNWLINNAIVAASTTYKATAAASYYYQNNGLHIWSNAPSGTAGNAVTFTQAMTLDASGNLLVGTTSTAGSASNNTKTIGGLFSTINGATGSTATGVAATLFTAPNEAVFIVSAYIVGSAAASNYNAVAIVKVSGGNAAITTISSASNLTISLSGLNVQATQTSGINQAFAYSAVRIS